MLGRKHLLECLWEMSCHMKFNLTAETVHVLEPRIRKPTTFIVAHF